MIDESQYKLLKAELTQLIDADNDSLRFYRLGDQYKTKIDHVGAKTGYQPDGVLIL